MSSVDIPLRAMVESLVNAHGTEMVYHRIRHGGYDPISGRNWTFYNEWDPVEEDYIAIPYEPKERTFRGVIEPMEYERDNKTLREIKVTMAASVTRIEPTPEDRLIIEGVRYRIVSVDPIYSGDLVASYVLQARR